MIESHPVVCQEPGERRVPGHGTEYPAELRRHASVSVGVTTQPGAIAVAPDGTHSSPVLILRHDPIGERALVATSTATLFTPVKADVLVAPRTMSAPDFLDRG